ncbi:Plasmodium exported protein (PHIST), unknown function [Plasmodium reichenowi]|uniref:Uncharacterized protein n=1 Tax=Plasmodium reichenowi TaxID=5854 RepID=A0A2P9DRK7_PLARE|nr:Plasmodium exported protein (PHIST), unknown function [Plasmodium reichenowi]
MIGIDFYSIFNKIFIFLCLKASCFEFFYLGNEYKNSWKVFIVLKCLFCFSIYLFLMMSLFLLLCCILRDGLPSYLSSISKSVNAIIHMQIENDSDSDEFKSIIDDNTIVVNNTTDTSYKDARYFYTEHIFSSYTSSGSYRSNLSIKKCRDFSLFENKEDIYILLYSLHRMPKKCDIMGIWYQAIYVAKNSYKMKENLKKYMWCYFANYPKAILPYYKESIKIILRNFSDEVSFRMYPYLIKYNKRFIKLVEIKPKLNIIVKYIWAFTEFLDRIKRDIYFRYKRGCFKFVIDYNENLANNNTFLKYIDIPKN